MLPAAPEQASVRMFVRAKTLAARLSIHPATLRRWASAGLIQRFKVNQRVVLYDDQEATALIQSARVTNGATGEGHS